MPDADLNRQREVVDAFLAAVRGGDFDALIAVLDPDVVVGSDLGPGASRVTRGARAAQQALMFSRLSGLVNGAAGIVSWRPSGEPFSVIGFNHQIREDRGNRCPGDPARLRWLDLSVLND
jgi:hypothetical protein